MSSEGGVHAQVNLLPPPVLNLGANTALGKSGAQDLSPADYASLLSDNSAQSRRNLISHAASMPTRFDTSAPLLVTLWRDSGVGWCAPAW